VPALQWPALLILFCFSSVSADEQCDPPAASPLQPFEFLVGGTWELEGSYQVFEWSLDKTLLKSRSWYLRDGEPVPSSEGFWYWHPSEQTIRGTFIARAMPVVVFDYTTCFRGSIMVNQLRGIAADGKVSDYREIWEFQGSDHYLWRLYQDGDKPILEGRFSRVME